MDWNEILTVLVKAVLLVAAPVVLKVMFEVARNLADGIRNAAVRDIVRSIIIQVEKDLPDASGAKKRAAATQLLCEHGLMSAEPLIDVLVAELDQHLTKLSAKLTTKCNAEPERA